MQNLFTVAIGVLLFVSCSAKSAKNADESVNFEDSAVSETEMATAGCFSADSAYTYLKKQVDFGPRVPNSDAHRLAGEWMVSELKRHGAAVTEQKATLKAFDGTMLNARNIFGQYNPEATDRTLLLAHYDCRPWADEDPDPANHSKPVDGANDGASGVAVLLEIARQLNIHNPKKGIDILFVDAEDWGEDGNDDSWAMGTRYFANNPIVPGYSPSQAILLDMVGGKDAKFPVEYFSQQNAPELVNQLWSAAALMGHGDRFPKTYGSAVTDDHVELIKVGVPAIDIIEYNPQSGFSPHWHTTSDTIDNIDKNTLAAVGQTLLLWIVRGDK